MDLVEHRVVRLQAVVPDAPRFHLPEDLVLPARGERADRRDDRLRRPEEANDPLAVHEMASSREDAVEDLRCGRLRIEKRPAHVEEDVAHVLERLVAARSTRLQSHHGPSSNRVRKALRRPYPADGHPAPGTQMADDPTRTYFAGTDRDRAAFEAGLKLGSVLHQYVGTPLATASAGSLERAIEAATRGQPLVEPVRARIDPERPRIRGPYPFGVVTVA